MNLKYSYAREKLNTAIQIMATGKGDIKERLLHASLSFNTLNENNFPPELHADWAYIVEQMRRYGPKYDFKGMKIKGAVENTMHKIRRSIGEKIALKLYLLYWEINNNEKYV